MKKNKKNKLYYEDGAEVVLGSDDAPELTEAMARKLRPAKEVLPELLGKKVAEALFAGKAKLRPVGRPKAAAPKQQITFRFEAEVTEAIKAMGPGYNARVEAILRDAFL